MRTAKVCIIGDFAVGKTSTVARLVKNEFSEKYLTTVGVKIDTKVLETAAGPIKLILWNVAGTSRLTEVELAYLRGSAGYIFVADGTRPATLYSALRLKTDVSAQYGTRPFVALLNKADLSAQWQIGEDEISASSASGIEWTHCSAKSGDGVVAAFQRLANAIMQPNAEAP